MRKFICTADIHIKISKDIPEQWQIERYDRLFFQIIEECWKYGAELIIAGDLLDKAHPTLQELKLVFDFFERLRFNHIKTYLISGNHENIASGIDSYMFLSTVFPDNVRIVRGDDFLCEDRVMIHFKNHCNLQQEIDLSGFSGGSKHVLVTHFRTNVSEYIREEIDTQALCSQFDLVIAGDIHTDLTVGNLVYTNQPINSQFETNPATGYVLLEVDKSTITYKRIPTNLPSLVQLSCEAGEVEEVLSKINDTDFYRLNISGTLKELRNVKLNKTNVRFNKLPIIEEHALEESQIPQMDAMALDMQLIEYLKLIPYSDENINCLLDIWKEVA